MIKKEQIDRTLQRCQLYHKVFQVSKVDAPDIVLKSENETIVIDTKWKRPGNSSASVSDLRQMYTYCRFWDAEKAMLLYPGEIINNDFKEFKTLDFFDTENTPTKVKHQCKMGFVSVLDADGELDEGIGRKVLGLVEDDS